MSVGVGNNETANPMGLFISELQTKKGVLEREFRRNEVIVPQGAKNSCLYRLLSGSVRFDKEIKAGGGEKFGITTVGVMDYQSEWNFFCLMSGLEMEDRTTASVVVESKRVRVLIVPSSVLFEVGQRETELLAAFLRGVAIHLAQILRGVHLRSLGLTNCGVSFPPLQVKEEAAMMAWPASVKKGFGFAPCASGSLVVSTSYLGFLVFKGDEEGGERGSVEGRQFLIFSLKNITKISFVNEKVFVEEGEEKLVVVVDPTVNMGFVQDTLITMWSLSKTKKTKAAIQRTAEKPGAGVRECKGCSEGFCSYCAAISMIKNPCLGGSSHSLKEEPTEGRLCGRCGNGGTHILSSGELRSFLERFPVERYVDGGMIVEVGSECCFVGYVLEGEINVEVITNGTVKRAGNIEAGEIFGEIGCLLGSESSATLRGGSGGTLVMKIPKEFVLEQQDSPFSSRFFLSLVQLIWKRIKGQERTQLESLRTRCQEAKVTSEKQISKVAFSLSRRDYEMAKWVLSKYDRLNNTVSIDHWKAFLSILERANSTPPNSPNHIHSKTPPPASSEPILTNLFRSLVKDELVQDPTNPLRQSCGVTAFFSIGLELIPLPQLHEILTKLSKKISIHSSSTKDIASELVKDPLMFKIVEESLAQICLYVAEGLPSEFKMMVGICLEEYQKLRQEAWSVSVAFMDNLELGQWSLCIVMLYIVSPYLMKIDKYLKRKKTLKKLGGLPRLTAIILQKAASSSTFESHHSLSILNPCVERLSQIFTTHSTTLPSPSSSEDLDLFFFSHPPSSPEEDEVETNEDSSESSSTSDTITGPTVSDLETSLGSSLGSYPRSSLESHSAPILSSESKEKGALLGTSVLFLRKKVAKNLQESPGLRMSLEQGAEGFSFGGRKSKRRKEPEIELEK